ncbi:hypothetical protein B0H15DRAFT_793361 [Mycena belliarum]|uniref:CxC2-like cysteine cluster KDZ transposase-associated domain-containing protein n=1 Tax=Mycena belliarum TaxID=1033014 RepID=A0AAD6TS78_9AGAR|nr:hypothetical protein B0H15DRAFT_793361 [Mycena belliae]
MLHLRDTYLGILLWRAGRGNSGETCPQCNDDTKMASYRCRECGGGVLLCRECCLDKHADAPLHILDEWSGVYFFKRTLRELGQRIQMGHPPYESCDMPRRGHQDFVVIHRNGIHTVDVDFCGCDRHGRADDPHIQLLKAGWYPATDDRPQTCATFEVLDHFQLHALQAKTSAYDFYAVLERLTDGTGVKPPDRYQVFLRMAREFRHLLMLLRAGRPYDPAGVWGTGPGELAVLCPVCPRPGVNLPEGWENAPEEDQCLYIIFLAMDACFRLKRRMISSELRDPGLGTGWAYMLETTPYRRYLLTVTDQKEMSTCSGLAALDHANTKFSKGYSTTGVGMGVCARHEFVQPNGVGDLQKGERYANMDYIFASILRHLHPLLRKIISYDIVCQWWKDLVERLKKLPPMVRISIVLDLFRFVIPKMHIHSHTLLCQLLFSLNLVPGSANTDGEGIERPWSWIGGLAGSTRASGPGARADAIDCHWNYWNWTKLLGLPALLRRRLDNAKIEAAKHAEAFTAFTMEQSDRVPQWKAMVDAFEKDGTQKNPYEAEIKGLTEMQVRLQLAAVEDKEVEAGVPAVHEVSPSTFIAAGLDLEDEQRRVRIQAELKKSKSTALQINLRTMRRSLNQRILKFRKLQATYQPASLVFLRTREVPAKEMAEDVPLLLPSALTAAQRGGGTGCMAGLQEIERVMRDSQCRAALVRLRNQLHVKSRLLLYKKNHARHQGMNTRSRTIVARNESKIRLESEKYQDAWRALVALDGNEHTVGWPKLKKEDIRCMQDSEELSKKAEKQRKGLERRMAREAALRDEGELPPLQEEEAPDDDDVFTRPGENVRQVSWIWTLAGTAGTDAELEDALRIEWAKSFARTRRWNEEVRLLNEEWRRLPVSYAHREQQWLDRAVAVPVGEISDELAEGMIAYASKHAQMYRRLAARAETTRTELKLRKGERRVQRVAEDELMTGVEGPEDWWAADNGVDGNIANVAEEEEDGNIAEEDDDDERGDIDSEEELLLGGEVDED